MYNHPKESDMKEQTKTPKRDVPPVEVRARNMRRVLMPLYERWVEEGRPARKSPSP